jgi:hypothetical protein
LISWSIILGLATLLIVRFNCNVLTSGSVDRLYRTFSRQAAKYAEHPYLCMTAIATFVIVLRLCALPVLPIPEPRSHDEFSYLLGAETFASGRITNPQHPLWQFFETEHVLVRPTYMSKYPPAQALALASGLKLGSYWYGVLGSFAVMCSLIFWMACGYLPVRWALLAGVLPLVHPGIASYWCNSYFGGAMAAIGAALVFGACARLCKEVTTPPAVALSIGLVILANSRPFEGLAATVVPLCWLLHTTLIKKRLGLAAIRSHLVYPMLVLTVAAAGMFYFNYRITGNAMVMPYFELHKQYSPIPLWLGKPLAPVPIYNNPQLRDNYARADLADFNKVQTFAGWLDMVINDRLMGAMYFFVGIWLMPMAAASLLSLRDGRVRILWLSTAVMSGAIALEVFFQRHYLAPITAPLYVLLVQGFRHLRLIKLQNRQVGLVLARLVLAVAFLGVLIGLFNLPTVRSIAQHEQDVFPRLKIMKQLSALPGKQLVIVHYADGHDPRREYVVNSADIDGSKVVWARDLGADKNKQLLDYYRDRQVWYFDPDCLPEPRLYTLEESKSANFSKSVSTDSWLQQ